MAETFVTGIAPTQNVAVLEKMLDALPGIDRARLSVINNADRGEEHDRSFLNFIHAGGPEIEAKVVGEHVGGSAAILGGSGGTGVPGLAADNRSYDFLSHPRVAQRIGNLPIPDDEADNYNDAIEDGRSIVACKIAGDKEAVMAAFRAAGLLLVRAY